MTFKKTQDEAIDLWLEALESGDYKQTRDVLHDDDGGYCCLGVACDLYEKHEGPLDKKWRGGISVALSKRFTTDDEGSGAEVVKSWLGLVDDEGGCATLPDEKNSLAEMNDEKFDFLAIAEAIRSRRKYDDDLKVHQQLFYQTRPSEE
jgi:hypothetical protein